jgi:putative oxidoreductase
MIRFFATDDSRTLLFQRLVLAVVVLGHGAQKLLGWFGGYGFEGTMGYFTGTIGAPAAVAVLIILLETFGMIALAAGALTRFLAGSLGVVMVGAIAFEHGRHGFFMDWSGAMAGEGFEFHLLALALSLPLAVRGAGAWSIDGLMARTLRVGSVGAARQVMG